MKPVNLLGHIHYPAGLWFRVCGGRCFTFRLSSDINFDHLQARSK